MFFLGLAGSFLPYLLCLGVLFFLTLGTNNNKDIELAELDNKKIEDFTLDSYSFNLNEDCYFFDQQFSNSNEKQETSTFNPMFGFFDCITQPKFLELNIPSYRFHFEKNRSGLSPPVLIS